MNAQLAQPYTDKDFTDALTEGWRTHDDSIGIKNSYGDMIDVTNDEILKYMSYTALEYDARDYVDIEEEDMEEWLDAEERYPCYRLDVEYVLTALKRMDQEGPQVKEVAEYLVGGGEWCDFYMD